MSATLYIIRRIYTWINTLYIQIFCIFVKSLIFSNRQYAKIQGTCFKLQAIYFEIHALSFLLYALYGFDWRKNILKSRNKWIYATAILHDFDYFYSRFPLEHNSMRLIVLIRSFNPRRTQFILQDIEIRGKSFNPRAHTGRDTVYSSSCNNTWFQSTRPHGARHATFCQILCYLLFQSTRPHGARRDLEQRLLSELVFQSTRPHGARQTRTTTRRMR